MSLALVGPRFEPLLASRRSRCPPMTAAGWKYSGFAKFWPISSEPITLPPALIRLPFACCGKITWQMPVIASG